MALELVSRNGREAVEEEEKAVEGEEKAAEGEVKAAEGEEEAAEGEERVGQENLLEKKQEEAKRIVKVTRILPETEMCEEWVIS